MRFYFCNFLNNLFFYSNKYPLELPFLIGVTDQSLGRFEYPYLFGTNEIEKIVRLVRIKKRSDSKYYDLDFFRNKNLCFGNVLIFGISFLRTSVKNDSLKEYLNDLDPFLLKYIDGHILRKLSLLQHEGRVQNITFSCWKEEEVSNYEQIIKDFDLKAEIVVGKTLDFFVNQ